jgi:hypothetical protein
MALHVVAAAAAAVLLNVLLLGKATGGNDPVGRLQPRLELSGATTTAPEPSLRPTTTTDDDQHGRGHDSDDD